MRDPKFRDQGKEFLGRGWAFPFDFERDRGVVRSTAFEEDVHQSIYIILSTAPGERVMRPEFGCGIHDLVFGVINTALVTQIKHHVKTSLRDYEARVDLLGVEVDTSQSIDGRLNISIDYQIRSTNQSGNYVFPFYFKEAS